LIWISATGSQATVYPAITGYTAVGSWGFLRVPQALLAVPCLAYDSYARADGSLGSTEASGPDGQAANARSYQGGSTWQINSHKALTSMPGASCSPTLVERHQRLVRHHPLRKAAGDRAIRS
jgi:hypothetical protein